MRISVNEKFTIIEATADELRQSNTLSDSFTGLLRRCLNGVCNEDDDDIDVEETEENDHEG